MMKLAALPGASAARALAAAAVLQLLFISPSAAGWYYEAVSTIDLNTDVERGDVRIAGQSWIKDRKAKLLITESDNTLVDQGTWLVTTNGGETIHRVDPRAKTFQALNVKELTKNIDAVLRSMGGTAGITFDEPTVEKLAEEPGPEILGYDTIHSVHRASYSITVELGDYTQEIKTRVRREQWSTPAIDFPISGVWLGSLQTGIKGLDRMMADAADGTPAGFPLKTIVVSSTDVQGRVQATRSTTEVVLVEERDVEDAIFMIPSDYKGIQSPDFGRSLPRPSE